MIETVRALVRPYLAYAFGTALIAAAFFGPDAFERMKEPSLLIVGYYFGSRTNTEAR